MASARMTSVQTAKENLSSYHILHVTREKRFVLIRIFWMVWHNSSHVSKVFVHLDKKFFKWNGQKNSLQTSKCLYLHITIIYIWNNQENKFLNFNTLTVYILIGIFHIQFYFKTLLLILTIAQCYSFQIRSYQNN